MIDSKMENVAKEEIMFKHFRSQKNLGNIFEQSEQRICFKRYPIRIDTKNKNLKLRGYALSKHSIMKTIGIEDIKLIHEKSLSLRGNLTFSHISHRQLYFVAACALLDPENDRQIALNSDPMVV